MSRLRGLASLKVLLLTDFCRVNQWHERGDEALRMIELVGPWQVGVVNVSVNWPSQGIAEIPPRTIVHKENVAYQR